MRPRQAGDHEGEAKSENHPNGLDREESWRTRADIRTAVRLHEGSVMPQRTSTSSPAGRARPETPCECVCQRLTKVPAKAVQWSRDSRLNKKCWHNQTSICRKGKPDCTLHVI